MSSPAVVPGRKYLKKRAVATRYGKSSLKTIDRWVAKKILPPPDFEINGIGFWGEDRLDEGDRARTIEAGQAKVQRAKPAAIPNHKEPQSAP